MIVLFVFGYMFHKLASTYGKNAWIWALVGAGSYIAIQLLIGFVFGVLYAMDIVPDMSDIMLNILAVAVSSGVVYLGYRYLKNKWDSADTRFDIHRTDEINNIGRNPE